MLHLTILMLDLHEAGMIERAREAMASVEPRLKEVLSINGGKLKLEFDELGIFGTPEETRVIFMKLKEDSQSFEVLKEINGILIQAMIDHKVVDRSKLSHI
jgi:2'-5' RNA ligase